MRHFTAKHKAFYLSLRLDGDFYYLGKSCSFMPLMTEFLRKKWMADDIEMSSHSATLPRAGWAIVYDGTHAIEIFEI